MSFGGGEETESSSDNSNSSDENDSVTESNHDIDGNSISNGSNDMPTRDGLSNPVDDGLIQLEESGVMESSSASRNCPFNGEEEADEECEEEEEEMERREHRGRREEDSEEVLDEDEEEDEMMVISSSDSPITSESSSSLASSPIAVEVQEKGGNANMSFQIISSSSSTESSRSSMFGAHNGIEDGGKLQPRDRSCLSPRVGIGRMDEDEDEKEEEQEEEQNLSTECIEKGDACGVNSEDIQSAEMCVPNQEPHSLTKSKNSSQTYIAEENRGAVKENLYADNQIEKEKNCDVGMNETVSGSPSSSNWTAKENIEQDGAVNSSMGNYSAEAQQCKRNRPKTKMQEESFGENEQPPKYEPLSKRKRLSMENVRMGYVPSSGSSECSARTTYSKERSDDIAATEALLEMGGIVNPQCSEILNHIEKNSCSPLGSSSSTSEQNGLNSSGGKSSHNLKPSSSSSSSKRAYGQVTRLKNGRWKCFDGTEFDMSYKAYRHLKNLRANTADDHVMPPPESTQKTKRTKRKCIVKATKEIDESVYDMYGKNVDISKTSNGASLYEMFHQWWLYESSDRDKLKCLVKAGSNDTSDCTDKENNGGMVYQSKNEVDSFINSALLLEQAEKATVAPLKSSWDVKRVMDTTLNDARRMSIDDDVQEAWDANAMLKEHVKKWKHSKSIFQKQRNSINFRKYRPQVLSIKEFMRKATISPTELEAMDGN
eukprot:Nk52_evm50s240 gene=Nk52_evmTU50s240